MRKRDKGRKREREENPSRKGRESKHKKGDMQTESNEAKCTVCVNQWLYLATCTVAPALLFGSNFFCPDSRIGEEPVQREREKAEH